MPPSQPQNIIHGWNSNSENEINNRNNKTRLRNELTNLYGGNNGFLNSREINGFVGKLNRNNTNTLNIKQQAYKKAYSKYMNYMAGPFTQDIIKAIKAKMKSSPKCPSGVEGGGPSLIGALKAVGGGVKAAASKHNTKQNAKNKINKVRHLTNENKKEFKGRINRGEDSGSVLSAARERARLR
jgi:hypothetical protein